MAVLPSLCDHFCVPHSWLQTSSASASWHIKDLSSSPNKSVKKTCQMFWEQRPPKLPTVPVTFYVNIFHHWELYENQEKQWELKIIMNTQHLQIFAWCQHHPFSLPMFLFIYLYLWTISSPLIFPSSWILIKSCHDFKNCLLNINGTLKWNFLIRLTQLNSKNCFFLPWFLRSY